MSFCSALYPWNVLAELCRPNSAQIYAILMALLPRTTLAFPGKNLKKFILAKNLPEKNKLKSKYQNFD